MKNKPQFVIVNDTDAPVRGHVAQWIEGVGYCYMARNECASLKDFDGMNPKNPTPIEDFGFRVDAGDQVATFVRIGPSVAMYEDGHPRKWQDRQFPDDFILPMVSYTRGRFVRREQ